MSREQPFLGVSAFTGVAWKKSIIGIQLAIEWLSIDNLIFTFLKEYALFLQSKHQIIKGKTIDFFNVA